MKNLAIFFLILLSSLIILFSFSQRINISQKQTKTQSDLERKPKILINDVEIFIDIADTPEKQQKGLSGRKSLKEDEGMLFTFNTPSQQYFWMKEMLFPIDIIWIKDREIVFIHENVLPPKPNTPDEKLPLYSAPFPVDKVLEVNAGFTQKNKIKIGDKINLLGI